MLLPIIRDKSHDPFIIFGGLFSRDLIFSALKNLPEENNSLKIIESYCDEVKRHCPNENYLRKKIAEHLFKDKCFLPANSQGDIFVSDIVVEVKNNLVQLNLDDLRGSIQAPSGKRKETAEEELFRYFKKHPEKNWGILTSGRVFRIYHRNDTNCHIEFDLSDISTCKVAKHASLFLRLINDPDFRNSLYLETKGIREVQSEQKLEERVLAFFEACKEERPNNTKTCLFLLMIKYLEDIGVLPVSSPDYQPYSLGIAKNITLENLTEIVDNFLSGKWFDKSKITLFTDKEILQFKSILSKQKNLKAVKQLLFDEVGVPLNLSDIYIDHLGNIYQRVIHKHSEGAYYTPYSIGKKLTEYLTSLNLNARQKFAEDSNKVIIDPACGSGQLLRALIPFSHMFYDFSSRYLPKNSMRRDFISRLVGIDKDDESVFICKIGLALMGTEEGVGLATPRLMKQEDTLEAFLNSRSNFSEIPREHIFSIVTNPPWESLEFNESNLYRKVTGDTLPKKSSLQKATGSKKQELDAAVLRYEKWSRLNREIIQEEKDRVQGLTDICDQIGAEHLEYFKGKKNLAIYFMFVITKLLEQSQGSYLVVMPDRFFVGDDSPLRDKLFPEFEAYVPFQNCGSIFEGVDNGTRFGIIFGRKGSSKGKMFIDLPIMEGLTPVDFIPLEIAKQDLKVEETPTLLGVHVKFTLPFFTSDLDVKMLNHWMLNREVLTSWEQGRINLGNRNGNDERYGKTGGAGKYRFNIVKSEKRKSSDIETYRGHFAVEYGATIEAIPLRLVQHYRNNKVICPNVKRNGVRKIIASFAKGCLVEHDYNFNESLGEIDLFWIRSLTYNHLVNNLAGSYHINTSVQNFLGTIKDFSPTRSEFIAVEVELLVYLGFSLDVAVDIVSTTLLKDYEDDFIKAAYNTLDTIYPREFSNIQKNRLLIEYKRISNIAELASLNRSRFSEEVVEKRATVATYAISKMVENGYCGTTKLEKALYLLEATGCINLDGLYFREAAGPLDKEALYNRDAGIQATGKKKNYFAFTAKTLKNGRKFIDYALTPQSAVAISLAKKEFTSNKSLAEADRVLKLLSSASTEKAEIIATIYAAWNDLLAAGRDDNPNDIINEVRENWTESKKKFSPALLKSAILWLRANKLVPTGTATRTFKKSA